MKPLPLVLPAILSIVSVVPLAETDLQGGWSLFLRFGEFGLIFFVVAVLYPKEAAAARQERKERDDSFSRLSDKFVAGMESLSLTFREERAADRAEAARERQELMQAILNTHAAFRTAVHDTRDAAQTAISNVAAIAAEQAQRR